MWWFYCWEMWYIAWSSKYHVLLIDTHKNGKIISLHKTKFLGNLSLAYLCSGSIFTMLHAIIKYIYIYPWLFILLLTRAFTRWLIPETCLNIDLNQFNDMYIFGHSTVWIWFHDTRHPLWSHIWNPYLSLSHGLVITCISPLPACGGGLFVFSPSVCLSITLQFSKLFSAVFWDIDLKFCIWIGHDIIQTKFEFRHAWLTFCVACEA